MILDKVLAFFGLQRIPPSAPAMPIKRLVRVGDHLVVKDGAYDDDIEPREPPYILRTNGTAYNPLDSFAPFPDLLTAIDFETANKNPNSAISIGVTTLKSGKITGSRTWMIKPPVMRFNESFIDIHNITPDMVADKPTFAEIYDELEPYLESDALLAHYARFDREVLKGTASHYGIKLPKIRWICTCDLARAVWADLPNHKLPTVSRHLGINLNHHDAGSDANAAAEIYLKTVYGSGWGPGGWRTK